MKQLKPTSYARRQSNDLSKLRTEYNLEVEPLRTGLKQSNRELLGRMSGLRDGDLHHGTWLSMELWLIVITAIISITLVVLAGWAVVAYVDHWSAVSI